MIVIYIVQNKPRKKTDKELYALIEKCIIQGSYVFLSHAKQRFKERHISELEVIHILLNKKGFERSRNKLKDTYQSSYNFIEHDWKYCIEGHDLDGNKLRIIISFHEDVMPIITVIRL